MIFSRRSNAVLRLARAAVVTAAAAAAGCATASRFDATAARFDASSLPSVELADVPFFPQKQFQCGPAALATILAYEGLDVDPDALAPAVYVKGLKGSLQAELLAATRRHGLIPYVLEPTADDLFAEVRSGKPVLVLENLALPRVPVWHYAVVVGFDAERGDVVLRSGKRRRHTERLGRFLRHLRLGGDWAFVALGPDEPPPATATPERYVRALAGAEPLLGAAADAAYSSALTRWPRDPLVLFAGAGHELAAARYENAAGLYETLLALEPHHAAARNNLANALAEQGCRTEALHQARAALADVANESPLRSAIEDTVGSLERDAAAAAAAPEPASCAR
ncbi:MAG TPA: PA2778 family cysteine peptidase [Gammaproteobacteria bacterium]|nr:PA2778 family cysteine peptidase [Gammaproteobacteria bacterium]